MSAFLIFSQGRRAQLKEENPNLKNTEISRILGDIWRNAPDDVRQPCIEQEKSERERYKVDIARWRKENGVKIEQERKAQFEVPAAAPTMLDPYSQMMYTMGAGTDQYGGIPPIGGYTMMSPTPGMYGQPISNAFAYRKFVVVNRFVSP